MDSPSLRSVHIYYDDEVKLMEDLERVRQNFKTLQQSFASAKRIWIHVGVVEETLQRSVVEIFEDDDEKDNGSQCIYSIDESMRGRRLGFKIDESSLKEKDVGEYIRSKFPRVSDKESMAIFKFPDNLSTTPETNSRISPTCIEKKLQHSSRDIKSKFTEGSEDDYEGTAWQSRSRLKILKDALEETLKCNLKTVVKENEKKSVDEVLNKVEEFWENSTLGVIFEQIECLQNIQNVRKIHIIQSSPKRRPKPVVAKKSTSYLSPKPALFRLLSNQNLTKPSTTRQP